MSRSLITKALVLGVAVLAAGVWLMRPDEPEAPSPAPAPLAPPPPGSATQEPSAGGNPGFAESTPAEAKAATALRQRVDDLEMALKASLELREQAEAALEASESEVEELEAFITEIQQRGENPVDYEEEGMARFQPAFFRFQDAAAALDDARALEAEARSELAKARAALEALEADGPGR